jgi:hypothetical protein
VAQVIVPTLYFRNARSHRLQVRFRLRIQSVYLAAPLQRTSGIIQAFAFTPSDVGAPPQVASARLTDGAVVQA